MKLLPLYGISLTLLLSCSNSDTTNLPTQGNQNDKEVKLIFSEDFENTPDWTSGDVILGNFGHIEPPQEWYSAFCIGERWAPSNGHPDNHETIEILERNREKSRGESGKSAVFWRESYRKDHDDGTYTSQWNSDGLLSLCFDERYKEIYIEFWIRFGDNFTVEPVNILSKMFRVKFSGNKDNLYQNFLAGDNGPSLIWDHNVNLYGVRNFLAFRGDPTVDEEGNSPYYLDNTTAPGVPNGLMYGDASLNFSNYLAGMAVDGGHPKLKDKLNGGYLPQEGTIFHQQVFGKSSEWTKMAFYVKMNSAPRVNDGIMKQWIDDVQIVTLDRISWHNYRPDGQMPTWNAVHFGGNDYFGTYPNSAQHEEWYAIDDIRIYEGIPSEIDH